VVCKITLATLKNRVCRVQWWCKKSYYR